MFDQLSDKFQETLKVIKGQSKLTESNVDDAVKHIRQALLEADVNFKVAKAFIGRVKEDALGQKVLKGVKPEEQFTKIVHDNLVKLMGDKNETLDLKRQVNPILVVGLNGAGKTTFVGKLAKHLQTQKIEDIYLVPADNFRPAAKEQLVKHADALGIDYFDSDLSQTSFDIVQAAMARALELKKKVVIIDTAGRLQVDEKLMDELVQIRKSLSKPEVLLVADAMTGQEAVNVAKEFHDKVDLTGVVLSKMDSDAKGGAALSIREVSKVAIKFISVGEKLDDLEPFYPDRLAGRILDMGDIITLVEKAQANLDEAEAERLMKRLDKRQFSFNDFVKQMEQINKLGSMGSLLKMIPGMGGLMRQVGDLSQAESEMKRMKVMINSMTQKERDDHTLLNDSRIARIAKGSGHSEEKVKDFVKKFEQMREMMINMSSMMKGGAMPGLPGMGAMPGFRAPSKKGKNKSSKNSTKKSPFGKRFF